MENNSFISNKKNLGLIFLGVLALLFLGLFIGFKVADDKKISDLENKEVKVVKKKVTKVKQPTLRNALLSSVGNKYLGPTNKDIDRVIAAEAKAAVAAGEVRNDRPRAEIKAELIAIEKEVRTEAATREKYNRALKAAEERATETMKNLDTLIKDAAIRKAFKKIYADAAAKKK